MFGYEYDAIIRACMKRRADTKTSLTMSGLAEVVANIQNELEAEANKQKATDAEKQKHADEEDFEDADDPTTIAFEDMPEIKKLSKAVEDDDEKRKRVKYFQSYVRRLVATHVELCSETEPDAVIAQRFKESAAGKAHGDKEKKTFVGFQYNPNLCGESSSKPHIRIPPLRQNGDHIKRLIGIILQARDFKLDSQDLWLIFDAGREGNQFMFAK